MPIVTVWFPVSCTKIWSGSPGSIRNWRFTPVVPGGITTWGSTSPSEVTVKTGFPSFGSPSQTRIR